MNDQPHIQEQIADCLTAVRQHARAGDWVAALHAATQAQLIDRQFPGARGPREEFHFLTVCLARHFLTPDQDTAQNLREMIALARRAVFGPARAPRPPLCAVGAAPEAQNL